MNTNEFCLWLEGYIEAADISDDLTKIREKLRTVDKSLLVSQPIQPYLDTYKVTC
jgi:hypothetical protein